MLVAFGPLSGLTLGLEGTIVVYWVWAVSLVVWLPVFCLMVAKASRRDILLTGLYPLVSVALIFALEIIMFPGENGIEFHFRQL